LAKVAKVSTVIFFFLKKLLTIIIMIIVIIFFYFFFSAGSADLVVQAFKLKGDHNRPRRQGLQTPESRGCSQAGGSAPSVQGWADHAPGICMLGPRPAPASGGCSIWRKQASMA
jgi:hypothetical protein